MPELRKDPVTGRWVIISTERRKRPNDFRFERPAIIGREQCPFCPGREALTPHRSSNISLPLEMQIRPHRRSRFRMPIVTRSLANTSMGPVRAIVSSLMCSKIALVSTDQMDRLDDC